MERFNCLYLDKNQFGGLIFRDAIEYGLQNIEIAEGTTLLDAGCGSGEMSVFFASCKANVTGVDLDARRLSNASDKSRVNDLAARCRFLEASTESMTMISPGYFDVVFSMSTIQYMDRQKAIYEYLRVLRKGGSLILIENLPSNPFIKIYRFVRRLTAKNKKEKDYLRSIKGYLTFREINALSEHFEVVQHKQFHFLNVLSVFSFNKKVKLFRLMEKYLSRIDDFISVLIPGLKRFYWITAVVCLRKN